METGNTRAKSRETGFSECGPYDLTSEALLRGRDSFSATRVDSSPQIRRRGRQTGYAGHLSGRGLTGVCQLTNNISKLGQVNRARLLLRDGQSQLERLPALLHTHRSDS